MLLQLFKPHLTYPEKTGKAFSCFWTDPSLNKRMYWFSSVSSQENSIDLGAMELPSVVFLIYFLV